VLIEPTMVNACGVFPSWRWCSVSRSSLSSPTSLRTLSRRSNNPQRSAERCRSMSIGNCRGSPVDVQAAADRQSVGSHNVPAAAACGSEFHCGCTPFELSAQGVAYAPLIGRDRPVAVLPQLQRLSAGVANLDDIAGHREVEEPLGVVAVQVQAPVRGVRSRIRRVSAHIQRAGALPCQPWVGSTALRPCRAAYPVRAMWWRHCARRSSRVSAEARSSTNGNSPSGSQIDSRRRTGWLPTIIQSTSLRAQCTLM
jgi:hypothetical protein